VGRGLGDERAQRAGHLRTFPQKFFDPDPPHGGLEVGYLVAVRPDQPVARGMVGSTSSRRANHRNVGSNCAE
jgi:hypothetical protein